MNNQINVLATAIQSAIEKAPQSKGLTSAKAWVDALLPVLAEFPTAVSNMQDWISQGAGKSTSGIAYKSRHNKGVFPSEQLFCNTRAKARRPLDVVCKAIAHALVLNVQYNPDRFSLIVSEEGIDQGLMAFNKGSFEEKATINNGLIGLSLNQKEKKTVIKQSQELATATDRQSHLEAGEKVASTLEALRAKAERRLNRTAPAVVPVEADKTGEV